MLFQNFQSFLKSMPVNIKDDTKCSGCTACASICPVNAICMIPDDLGFLYPKVNYNKCINCNLCEKVCMYKKGDSQKNSPPLIVYGGRLIDESDLYKSQSGGAFWAIAQSFIKKGVIYAAGYDDEFNVLHKRATSIEACDEFRGSKYVQSDIVGIFCKIKEDLLNGTQVLFVGTGCQVDGLLNFLPSKLHENLYTIDLICHASPSPAIWKSYIHYLNKNKKLQAVNFRDKKFGWNSCLESFKYSHSIKHGKTFTVLWNKHLIMRSCCSNCLFTKISRKSDMTIGDYWGWEKQHNQWNDNKGVSLIIIHTEKGRRTINDSEDFINLIDATNDDYNQPQLQYPIEHSPHRKQFIQDFKTKGFYYIGCKYSNLGFINKIKELKRKLFKQNV